MAATGESAATPPATVNRRLELQYRLVVPASRQDHQVSLPVSGFVRRFPSRSARSRSARSTRRGEGESPVAFLARTAEAVRRIHSWSEL